MVEVKLARFAANLVRLMQFREMSQSELARRTGIRQQTISQYCNADFFPGFNRMVKIAKALGISFFDLTMQPEVTIIREIGKMQIKK